MWRFGVWVALGLSCAACGTSDGNSSFSGGGGGATGGDSGGGGIGGGSAGSSSIGASPKMDVVLVVDNSALMTEMQNQLANTIPVLVKTLTSKVQDLRVGVITTSLGSYGSTICADTSTPIRTEAQNDSGHLLGTRPRASSAGVPSGFVSWTAGAPTTDLISKLQALIQSAGQFGCGYEAPLESLYRFLVDPSPPESFTTGPCPSAPSQTCSTPTGTDTALLTERASFLRPDSNVVAIVLSNENDCSVRAGEQYYYAVRQDITLPHGSVTCATNPNDPCCYMCGTSPPAGCAADPSCSTAADPSLDKLNVRCFDQKRRFGQDFLYPIERYANALSNATICPSKANLDPTGCADAVPNPLFASPSGGSPRSPALVHLLAIVGVPWQTLKKSATATDIVYPTGAEMASGNVWPTIYGHPEASPPVRPLDPLMLESESPRTGTTPGTNEALAPPSAGYLANSVNGHELTVPSNDDLEFACIFPLGTPLDCAAIDASSDNPRPPCDCGTASTLVDNPECQSQDGTYGSTQRFGKAYPGLRELGVIHALGERGAAASICFRNGTNSAQPDYAYGPAVSVLAKELGIAP